MIGNAKTMTRALVSTLALGIAFHAFGLILLPPEMAQAGSGRSLEAQKAKWQGRYRSLLQEAASLQDTAQNSRENYARAQRRNYPRGGARQQFILDAEAAEKELILVREKIEAVIVEARHAAIPPHWLYEVDDEPIAATPAASASEDPDDRAGRNPLYLKD